MLLLPVDLTWFKSKGQSARLNLSFGIYSIELCKKKASHVNAKRDAPDRVAEAEKEVEEIVESEEAETKEDIERAKKGKFDIGKIMFFWNSRRLMINILLATKKFVFALIRHFHLRKFDLNMYVSSEDPFALGALCAGYYSIMPLVQPRYRFSFAPDFTAFEDNFELWGELLLHTRIYCIIYALIILIWHLPKIELYRFYRKLKK